MAWKGSLRLDYRQDLHGRPGPATPRTVARSRHDGPMRVLASLYPEAPSICHQVLVHPPGGLVGGDELTLAIEIHEGAHALITTPGATRFYRSLGAVASQQVQARVANGARLEWLPLETIAYSGCIAENRMRFHLAAQAEMIGWDILALGLPASDQAFVRGSITQSIEFPGRWLEHGTVNAGDTTLLDSPLGFAGLRTLATLWFGAGLPLAPARRDRLLEAARDLIGADETLEPTAGVTSAHDGIVVLRVLAPRVEPAMALLSRVWAAWREAAWSLPACTPRVWRT